MATRLRPRAPGESSERNSFCKTPSPDARPARQHPPLPPQTQGRRPHGLRAVCTTRILSPPPRASPPSSTPPPSHPAAPICTFPSKVPPGAAAKKKGKKSKQNKKSPKLRVLMKKTATRMCARARACVRACAWTGRLQS